MRPGRPLVLTIALGVAFCGSPARAQSIRDAVREHTRKNLERKPPPPKKKKRGSDDGDRRTRRQPQRRSAPRRHATGPAQPPEPEPAPAAPEGPELPQRVFGKHFKLDPQVGGGWRGWHPQQYPRVEVDGAGYFTWSISARLRLFKWVSLERGHYESNALASPVHPEASVAAQTASYVPKAAWLMGAIGFPFDFLIEPMIRYETRAHDTTARVAAGQTVRILPHDEVSGDDDFGSVPTTTAALRMTSSFETFVLAGKYNPGKAGMVGMPSEGIPPFYLGLGLIQYRKPYQLSVGVDTLDELLFDARFRGVGLAYGIGTPEIPEKFYVDFSGITGLGEVNLLHDLTLNEEVADGTLIGFTQGNVTVGYLYPLTRGEPTLLIGASLNGGGATFFFFKTTYAEGEDVATPINWDLLWGAQAYLTLPL